MTADRAIIAIQGPAARALLDPVAPEAAGVHHFAVRRFDWRGVTCLAAGTGYTGEDGVEVSVPAAAAALDFWEAVMDAGIPPAGLGARDTLRLEAGLPLHGHELGPGITPLQAGLGWVVAWTKPEFRGKKALEAERDAGVERLLQGLVCDGRQPPRDGYAVLAGDAKADDNPDQDHDRPIGVVTSGNFSPVLERGIALAFLPPELGPGARVTIDARGRRLPALVVPRPFVDTGAVMSATSTPHTEADIAAMLAFCGLSSIDELFDAVPAAIHLAAGDLAVAPGLSEPDTLAVMAELADANRVGRELVCFAGGGAYDHEVASVVRRVAFRAEFVTAYTPYQPEVAQGVLQALFEYQTMVARLAGLPIANASLYDGATATVEGANLAVAATGSPRLILSQGVNPRTRAVLATMAAGTGHAMSDAPLHRVGHDTLGSRRPNTGREPLIVQYPNYLGVIEDLAAARAAADRRGALLVVVMDPVAVGLLRSPGELGADVVTGEGQPFGTPLSFGGPYVGLFALPRQEQVRRLPGRLVGETVDTRGARAYVTTLRAREQDIRRERATSNVCTNQTLIAVCFAIQLGWLGTAGLRELALRCARGTRYARESLLAISGVSPLVTGPIVREFAIQTPADALTVVERMAEEELSGRSSDRPRRAVGRRRAVAC